MTQQELEQAQALLASITQGEWANAWVAPEVNMVPGAIAFLVPMREDGSSQQILAWADFQNRIESVAADYKEAEANAAFIAQAPTLVRKLLAEVGRQKKALRQELLAHDAQDPKGYLHTSDCEGWAVGDLSMCNARCKAINNALKEPTP